MTREYQEFINRAIEVAHATSIPPHFNPEEWKGKSFNCYAYALQLCMDFTGIRVVPGFLTRKIGLKDRRYNYEKINPESIISLIREDCGVLGLNFRKSTIEEPNNPNEYKIAIYLKERSDFHFARQELYSNWWSEKCGWLKDEIYIFPEKELQMHRSGYEFLGVFKLSKKE